MDLCWQSSVSAFKYAIQVGHNFLPRSKEISFNFMTVVSICSDFGAPKNKVWDIFWIYYIHIQGREKEDRQQEVLLQSSSDFS